MMILKSAKYVLSQTGLLFMADKARYHFHHWNTKGKRKKFRQENPEVKLPPDYLIYESFKLDYQKYYFGGRETARWVIENIRKHVALDNASILDWGCGPARVVRHMPGMLPASCRIFGTDYNPVTIQWNLENIRDVNFSLNLTEPPLPYPDHQFNAVYGISIFTHLSEKLHYQWFAELIRITRPGGILLLTLQGNAFVSKLTRAEKEKFEQGKIVVRGHTRVGHRTWSAFHPVQFVKKLAEGHEVIDFEEGSKSNGQPQQDVWIIRV
jgi:SAM-dependent methyltransferase